MAACVKSLIASRFLIFAIYSENDENRTFLNKLVKLENCCWHTYT